MNETNGDAELRDWLIGRVAFHLDRPPDAIEPDTELAVYGLDSVYAMAVISEIEDRLRVELDPADLRRYPTINALAHHLVRVAPG